MSNKWKDLEKNLNVKDVIYLIHLMSVDDTDQMFLTICSGTQDLAYFLLHYDRDLYEFAGAEELCQGNRIIWNYKELLNEAKKDNK